MKRLTRFFTPAYTLSERIVGLDVFRAVAILFVLLSHSIGFLGVRHPFRVGYFLGFLGVELFFVLSGFLIGSILMKILYHANGYLRLADVRAFWIRRWFRTLPAYYLVLMVWICLRLVLDFKSDQASVLGLHIVRYFFFVQNAVTPHPEFFNEAWSLAVEEWFYLLFPLVLLLHGRIVRHRQNGGGILLIISAFIIFTALVRFSVVWLENPEWNTGVRRMMPLRLDSIGIGILFAWFCYFFPIAWRRHRIALALTGLVLCGMSTMWLSTDVLDRDNTAGASFFSKTGLFTLFSISFGLWLPLAQSVRTLPKWMARPVVFVSLISYSLYLTHGMILATCAKLPLSDLGIFSVGWLLCFLVAHFFYTIYEHPMTKLRDRVTKKATERVTVVEADV